MRGCTVDSALCYPDGTNRRFSPIRSRFLAVLPGVVGMFARPRERGDGGYVKKIYVGNLPWSTTEDELREFFAQFGEVHSASIIMDRDTGRSRGFGFVEMEEADADRAISDGDGQDLSGRRLRVNEAQDRRAGGGPPRDRW